MAALYTLADVAMSVHPAQAAATHPLTQQESSSSTMLHRPTVEPVPSLHLLPSSLSTGQTSDGRLLVVALGSDGNAYASLQRGQGKGWSTQLKLGQSPVTLQGTPSLAHNQAGQLVLIAHGMDKQFYVTIPCVQSCGQATSSWQQLTGPSEGFLGNPVTGPLADRRTLILATGTDGKVYSADQCTRSCTWTNFVPVTHSSPVTMIVTPAIVAGKSGALTFFATSSDGHIYAASPQGTWTPLGVPKVGL